MQFVDTAGRIDKFNKKFGKTRFAKSLDEEIAPEAEVEAEATPEAEA
jgi:large subunit ribosomal protein L31